MQNIKQKIDIIINSYDELRGNKIFLMFYGVYRALS